MAEWTSDARDYLDGYLRQVGALARSQGDDGDEIAAGLREHITNEVEADATSLVTVEQLRKTLASVGTPEQVVSPDFTLAVRERKESGTQQVPPPPPPRRETPIVINAAPAKARSGCWLVLATVIVLLFAGPIIIAILGVVAGITVPAMSRAREAARRATCQNNLKHVGMVCKAYAAEHDDFLPRLSSTPGEFSIEPSEIYPKYLNDPAVLTCPSDPTPPDSSGSIEARMGDDSYFYLGYVVTDEEEGRAFIDAYRRHMAEGGGFDEDLPAVSGSGTGGSGEFLRLRESRDFARSKTAGESGAEVRLPSPAEIPVMFDCSTNHVPSGINVLYLDGHVDFVKMGTKFPAQQWFLDELTQIGQKGSIPG